MKTTQIDGHEFSRGLGELASMICSRAAIVEHFARKPAVLRSFLSVIVLQRAAASTARLLSLFVSLTHQAPLEAVAEYLKAATAELLPSERLAELGPYARYYCEPRAFSSDAREREEFRTAEFFCMWKEVFTLRLAIVDLSALSGPFSREVVDLYSIKRDEPHLAPVDPEFLFAMREFLPRGPLERRPEQRGDLPVFSGNILNELRYLARPVAFLLHAHALQSGQTLQTVTKRAIRDCAQGVASHHGGLGSLRWSVWMHAPQGARDAHRVRFPNCSI